MRGSHDLPSEANRYDGSPAPSRNTGVGIADAKAAAEEARENAECEHCGEDDYDDLKQVPKQSDNGNPRAPPEPIMLCSDCRDGR